MQPQYRPPFPQNVAQRSPHVPAPRRGIGTLPPRSISFPLACLSRLAQSFPPPPSQASFLATRASGLFGALLSSCDPCGACGACGARGACGRFSLGRNAASRSCFSLSKPQSSFSVRAFLVRQTGPSHAPPSLPFPGSKYSSRGPPLVSCLRLTRRIYASKQAP